MEIADIIAQKREQVAEQKEVVSDDEIRRRAADYHNIALDFKKAASIGRPAIVPQVDEPTGITPSVTLEERGKLFAKRDKVKALAVRPEGTFLQQQRDQMARMREEVHVPVLYMDWVIDEYQIFAAQLANADALTLTACIMDDDDAVRFVSQTHLCGMQVAMRCFTPQDVELGCTAGADIILADMRKRGGGFQDLSVLRTLCANIKGDATCLALAGVTTVDDAKEAYENGAQGVIPLPEFMEQSDVRDLIRQLEKE